MKTKKVEISHDSLARKIFSIIGGERQKEKEISQGIQTRYNYYKKSGVLLTKDDLAYLGPYLGKVDLSAEQRDFIRRSENVMSQKEFRAKMIMIGVIAILAISAIVTAGQWLKSNRLYITNNYSARALQTSTYDRTQAYNQAEKALEIDHTNTLAKTVMNDLLIQSSAFPFYTDVIQGDAIEKISDMDVSTDKKYLVAGSLDGKILLYGLNSDQHDTILQVHNGAITDVDFRKSPKEVDVLVTSGKDSTVILWHLVEDELRPYQVFPHCGPVFAVNLSYSRERAILYSITTDHILKHTIGEGSRDTFNVSQATCFELIGNHSFGTYLLAATRDSTVHIINTVRPDDRKEIKIRHGIIENMDLHTNGNHMQLAAGLENGQLLVLELRKDDFSGSFNTRQFEKAEPYDAHQDAIQDVILIKNGTQILTSSRDKSAKLWDSNGNLLKTFLGHNDGLRTISIVQDGRRDIVFTGGEDKTIKKWILEPYPFQVLPGIEGKVTSFAIARNAKRILVAENKKDLTLYHYGLTYAGEYAEEKSVPGSDRIPDISAMSISVTGDTILVPSDKKASTFTMMDVDGTILTEVPIHGDKRPSVTAFASDGRSLVTGYNSEIYIMDVGGTIKDTVFQDQPVGLACFSPNSNYLVTTAREDNTVYWWDLANHESPLTVLADHTDEVLSVAFSPDGSYLITGSKDNSFILYAISSKGRVKIIGSFQRHLDNINAIAFSPSGDRFLSASADGTLRLWHTKDLEEEKSYINLGKAVVQADFLSETKIITLDRDGEVKVWDSAFIDSPGFRENIYRADFDARETIPGKRAGFLMSLVKGAFLK